MLARPLLASFNRSAGRTGPRLQATKRVIVFTGARISAESGIPTFRAALAGLWSTFNPQALATVTGFRNDRDLVWSWHEARRHDVIKTTPNAGHLALGKMQTLDFLEILTMVTQNVDDLHQRGASTIITWSDCCRQ